MTDSVQTNSPPQAPQASEVPHLLDIIASASAQLAESATAYSSMMRAIDAANGEEPAYLPTLKWACQSKKGGAINVDISLNDLPSNEVAVVLGPLANITAREMLEAAKLTSEASTLLYKTLARLTTGA